MRALRVRAEGRLRRLERASSALGPLVKSLGLEDALALHRLKESWRETLGAPLSLHTSPTALKGGALFVNADSPAWLQQAGYYRAAMLEKLNPFGVADVRLRLGRVAEEPRKQAKSKKPLSEPDPALRAVVEEIVSPIKDADLRESVRRAATKALGRRKKDS